MKKICFDWLLKQVYHVISQLGMSLWKDFSVHGIDIVAWINSKTEVTVPAWLDIKTPISSNFQTCKVTLSFLMSIIFICVLCLCKLYIKDDLSTYFYTFVQGSYLHKIMNKLQKWHNKKDKKFIFMSSHELASVL